ncbi:hypothetical protein [Plantactinospora sp. B5E13]|uniref:hypothetical protein n=1 Tax=unclassified Plantactinospora TaxID=2631981 RepID=UPI00325C4848
MTESIQVRPELLRQTGQIPCQLAAELRGVRDRWNTVVGSPGDALGLVEVATAFDNLHDRWYDELSVHIRLLEELCRGVVLSADEYTTSDDNASTRLGDDDPAKKV